jgi:hypothetical protein
MVKSLERVVGKWVRNVQGAGEEYKEGVRNPSKNWQERTIAAKAKYAAELQKAIAEGRRESGVQRTGQAGYQEAALAKANRFAEGVALAEGDFRSAISDVLAFEQGLQARINAMPDATLEDRIKKSAEWQRAMAAFRKR